MQTKFKNCSVKVAVRECPGIENDASIKYYSHLPNSIIIGDKHHFIFDHVFGSSTTQKQIFNDLMMPLLKKVKEGFNCTVLAYGQTGTGKSYTMGLNCENNSDEEIGIVLRCLNELLKIEGGTNKISLWASFIEIYNEKVYDLLSDDSNQSILARGHKYAGSSLKQLNCIEECVYFLNQGNKNRHVRSTRMNSQSSRSHAIFTIHLHQHNGEKSVMKSCLNLVDLAGSEGVRRTGNQGIAMSEGVQINKGLLSIGKVLHDLTLGKKLIPYRDSVLTLVLQDSLNSNSFLAFLACISSDHKNLNETLSTLRFARNTKLLKTTPLPNITSNQKIPKIYEDSSTNQLNISQQPKITNVFTESNKTYSIDNNDTRKFEILNHILNSSKLERLFMLIENSGNSFDENTVIAHSTFYATDLNSMPNMVREPANTNRKSNVLVDIDNKPLHANLTDPNIPNEMSMDSLRRSRRIQEKYLNKIDRNMKNSESMGPSIKKDSIKEKTVQYKSKLLKKPLKLKNSILTSYFENNSNLIKFSLKKHRHDVLKLLNNGSYLELQALSRIGRKTAFELILHRSALGQFKSLKQVEKLPIWKKGSWKEFATRNLLN